MNARAAAMPAATDADARSNLIGRRDERARIALLLAHVRAGRSGALLLSGEPGIGKTALCAWARGQAGDMRVLETRGTESELDLPFAGLSELLAGTRDAIERLPVAQADALAAALAGEGGSDRFTIGAALLGVLERIAERRPVVAIVDDAQWLDSASADAFLFAVRRLRHEAVALVVAARPGSPFDSDHPGLARLVLGGLDETSARELLTHERTIADVVAEQLARAAEGNPRALLELPALLSDAQLSGSAAIDEPLPIGKALARGVLDGVSALPEPTRRAILIAAANGDERLQPVLTACSELGLADDALDVAESAGVISMSGPRFEFRHALVRSAIYHCAPARARREAHAALATIASGGEQRAWHLARATVGEDESVAAALERAGLDVRRRGTVGSAAATLERAAHLSPAGAMRVRRLIEAARDMRLAGRPGHALTILDEALAATADPLSRSDAQLLRARILLRQGRTIAARTLLLDEAQPLREVDPGRAARMLAEAALTFIPSGDAVAIAREANDLARSADDCVRAITQAALATALAGGGHREEAAALLERCLPRLPTLDPLAEILVHAARAWSQLDRPDLARRLLDRLIASARTAGASALLPNALAQRAELDFDVGHWAQAAADAQEAVELATRSEQPVAAAYALDCLARIAARAGEEGRCRALVADGLRLLDAHGNEPERARLASTLGQLELGLGRPATAILHLESVALARADLIEAYVRMGDQESAEEELAALEHDAERRGGRWALGTAARSRGLLSGEDALFADALRQFDAIPAPFEVARTHLCHGERLRRAGRRRDARDALRHAIEGFDRLGATPWAARARVELRATGATARRRRDDADRDRLTPHELRVALVVAGGASNREAAAALFLSHKTIEFHLAQIYRKLGVRRRTELALLAARRGWLEGATG